MELIQVIWLLQLVYSASAQEDLIVNTKYGEVEGHLVDMGDGRSVRSFLGIPYARPPIGNLRFRAPQEPLPWETPFVASTLGDICPQDPILVEITHPDWDRYDEDCLFLNIFTPYESSTPGPYPVYVFIHGGAYWGGSNINVPGHFYAIRDVISVVINYRLGGLGFLSTGDDAARGNYGLLDQRLALTFVQENIRNFNGDPDRVTVGGYSAGSASVGLHVISPGSNGLFQQALQMSGTDLSWWAVNHLEVNLNLTRQLAQDTNCYNTDNQQMVDCMRALSLEALRNGSIDTGLVAPTLGFSPVPDSASGIVPDYPINLRNAGQFQKVPIFIGKTTRETSPLLLLEPEAYNNTEFLELMTDEAETYFRQHGPATVESVATALTFQYGAWPDLKNPDMLLEKHIEVKDDIYFGVGMDLVAKAHASEGFPTYQYIFGYRSELTLNSFPEWFGVFHGADAQYYRGVVLLEDYPEVVDDMEFPTELPEYNETDKDFGNFWIDRICNFVKTSNPTPEPVSIPGGQSFVWSPFTSQNLSYVIMTNDTIENRINLRQRYNALWTTYIPWIINATSVGETGLQINWADSDGEITVADLLSGAVEYFFT